MQKGTHYNSDIMLLDEHNTTLKGTKNQQQKSTTENSNKNER